MSKSQKKFKEWEKKLQVSLETKSKSDLAGLPEQCRWLRYWGVKLRDKEPKMYAEIEKVETELLGEAANALGEDYLTYLDKAQKHRKGTKVRLSEILRYVYYFGNYAYSCYVASGKENKARRILQTFWSNYQRELIKNVEKLDESQVLWLLHLIKQSRDLGIEIEAQLVSKLEKIRQPPDAILVENCKNQLKEAENSLKQSETIPAIILADQSLELFLKDLCMRWGCFNEFENEAGKPFYKWGITDYLSYLSDIGEIDEKYKRDFYTFHDWRNCAQHKGLEPSLRIVRRVIDEITEFINDNLD